MKNASLYGMTKRAKVLLALVFITVVICYGPWSWAEEPGTIGFLFWSQVVMLIVTPVVACIVLSTGKVKETGAAKEDDRSKL